MPELINPPFASLLGQIRSNIPADLPIYLVGGAVRDAMLGRKVRDLDFAMPAAALQSARRVANELQAAYYPLDTERETGRVVLTSPEGQRSYLDFATFRGPDLEADLRARDFTVNAMAVDLNAPQSLIDPLGGAAHLRARQLHACKQSAFLDDPIRITRGVRLAVELNFRLHPDTLAIIRKAISGLTHVSAERVRDELVRMFEGVPVGSCLQALDVLGLIPYLLPELSALRGLEQPPPHINDAWRHTLDAINKLSALLNVLAVNYDPDSAANLITGQVSLRLGRYRQLISDHLAKEICVGRSGRGLLFLAALYHDVGKAQARQEDETGRVRFLEHEVLGADLLALRGRELHLGNPEIGRLYTIVRHHMRPILLANTGKLPSSRAIYRFYRDVGEAGVDICLLSLADVWATYGPDLSQDIWHQQVEVVRSLLEGWWERQDDIVRPPALLNGDELMAGLSIKPGPLVGKLLEIIREAQVEGIVTDRQGALDLARIYLEREV